MNTPKNIWRELNRQITDDNNVKNDMTTRGIIRDSFNRNVERMKKFLGENDKSMYPTNKRLIILMFDVALNGQPFQYDTTKIAMRSFYGYETFVIPIIDDNCRYIGIDISPERAQNLGKILGDRLDEIPSSYDIDQIIGLCHSIIDSLHNINTPADVDINSMQCISGEWYIKL